MSRYLALLFFAIGAVIFLATHFIWLAEMPEKMATHFNGAGRANGWMSRESHGMLMPLIGLGVPSFIVILCWSIRYFPPSLMNVPKPEFWRAPENYPKACEILLTWACWQAVFTLTLMTVVNHQVMLANQQSPPLLNSTAMLWIVAGFVVAILGAIVWLFVRFLRTDSQ